MQYTEKANFFYFFLIIKRLNVCVCSFHLFFKYMGSKESNLWPVSGDNVKDMSLPLCYA